MADPAGYAPTGLADRVRAAARDRGARAVAGEFARWGLELATGGSRGQFTLEGRSYPYLAHRYKRTWVTERAVEVPVAREVVATAGDSGRVLEVGHVLGHYGPVAHTVVDKYETAPGVLNRDALDLGDLGPYSLIVAISTVEHVGWDEAPRDPHGAARAIAALQARLEPGGRLWLSVPVGYNPHLDAALRDGSLGAVRATALQRSGRRWREVPVAEAWGVPYDFLLFRARAVVFAELTADGRAG
jgi:hypothetical protein